MEAAIERIGASDLPEDWLAAYSAFNGVDAGDHLARIERAVFLEWQWHSLDLVVMLRDGAKARRARFADCTIPLGSSVISDRDLALGLDRRYGDSVPILATSIFYPDDRPIAFDNVRSLLGTICAVHDARLVSYENGRPEYDKVAVASLANAVNPRNEYWKRIVEGAHLDPPECE